MNQSSIKLHLDDLENEALALCSDSAKWIWVRLVFYTGCRSPVPGKLLTRAGTKPEVDDLARMFKEPRAKVLRAISELESCGVLARDESGVIVYPSQTRRAQLGEVRRRAVSARYRPPPEEALYYKSSTSCSTKPLQNVEQNVLQNSLASEEEGDILEDFSIPKSSYSELFLHNTEERTTETAVLLFPVIGGPDWPLFQQKLDEWKATFPALDVLAQCRLARQWCIDNPSRRKTARGIGRFLFGWLERAQNRGAGSRVPAQAPNGRPPEMGLPPIFEPARRPPSASGEIRIKPKSPVEFRERGLL